jgi:hypothetical protein
MDGTPDVGKLVEFYNMNDNFKKQLFSDQNIKEIRSPQLGF